MAERRSFYAPPDNAVNRYSHAAATGPHCLAIIGLEGDFSLQRSTIRAQQGYRIGGTRDRHDAASCRTARRVVAGIDQYSVRCSTGGGLYWYSQVSVRVLPPLRRYRRMSICCVPSSGGTRSNMAR